MCDFNDRRVVLRLLAGGQDHVALQRLGSLDEDDCAELLRWLDQSGLALYLAGHLADSRMLDLLPIYLRSELERRVYANRDRTDDLSREFDRVNRALRNAGIEYAVLKGFALTPEFCEQACLRHQTDIDILVNEDWLQSASKSLAAIGYSKEGEERSGEIRLGIWSGRPASANDFLYDLQRHRQVEIHRSFYESVNGVSLRPTEEWSSHVEWKIVEGVEFPSLDLPYRVLGQLLHAFRHVLHGWLRVGWLYEINHVVRQHRSDSELWKRVEGLMLDDVRVREACGVVLSMTAEAFGTELPELLQRRCVAPMRKPLILWLDSFGMEWLLSDFPGSRLSLLLHREFADSTKAWQQFRIARSKRRLGAITLRKLANPVFLARRFREQVEYFRQYLYWNMQVSKRSIEREGSIPHSSR